MIRIKKQLHDTCIDYVENRYQTIQKALLEIQESLTTETKSSAGDKHETGRAMLQLEREKLGNQLAEVQKVKENLSKINTSKSTEYVGLGSIVYTTKSNYFIAISAGELQVENEVFYAISSNTPIGQLLMGKTVGNAIVFREQHFIIEKIV